MDFRLSTTDYKTELSHGVCLSANCFNKEYDKLEDADHPILSTYIEIVIFVISIFKIGNVNYHITQ